MGHKKVNKPRAPRLVSAEYGSMLRATAKRAGLGWEALAREAGISPVTAWRVTGGDGSLKAAMALRDALVRLGQSVPPPTVYPEGEELAEWVAIGRELFSHPIEFTRVVSQLRALMEQIRRSDDAMRAIAHPLPTGDTSAQTIRHNTGGERMRTLATAEAVRRRKPRV